MSPSTLKIIGYLSAALLIAATLVFIGFVTAYQSSTGLTGWYSLTGYFCVTFLVALLIFALAEIGGNWGEK